MATKVASSSNTAATTTTDANTVQNGGTTNVVAVKFDVLFEKFQSMQTLFKELQSELKTLCKDVNRVVKESHAAKKKGTKRRAPSGDDASRPPSGFAKPTKLSAKLCSFLGVPEETLLARTEVTRKINQYIKERNLQDSEDKRKINPDNKLKTLLDSSITAPLTYFNLQARIKHHFLKIESDKPSV